VGHSDTARLGTTTAARLQEVRGRRRAC